MLLLDALRLLLLFLRLRPAVSFQQPFLARSLDDEGVELSFGPTEKMSVITPTSSIHGVPKSSLTTPSTGSKKASHALQKVLDGDEVSLSLLSDADQLEAAELLNSIVANAKDTLLKASKLRDLYKTVIFAENVSNGDQLYIHPGSLIGGVFVPSSVNNTGDVDVNEIIDAQVLLVAPLHFCYQPSRATVVENVKISVESKNPNRPKRLDFSTGKTYILFNGYSIQACYNLHVTKSLTLSGLVRKREASQDDDADYEPVRLRMD